MGYMVIIVSISIVVFLLVLAKRLRVNKNIDINHVNENSFQRYAKFYGEIYPSDKNFDFKLNNIYKMVSGGVYDIKKISDTTKTTIPECIIKIRYLKNKRLIGDLYVDTVNLKLYPCSSEDEKLLDKYKPYIYGSHLQVDEIAALVSNPDYLDVKSLRKQVLDDLVYLNNKGLINGIRIQEVDGEIIYYTIEKRKVFSDLETVHCSNCGALNDVDKRGKVRCSYCKSIISGSDVTSL